MISISQMYFANSLLSGYFTPYVSVWGICECKLVFRLVSSMQILSGSWKASPKSSYCWRHGMDPNTL